MFAAIWTKFEKRVTDVHYLIGLDVGSTTVKIIVRSHPGMQILAQIYRRHESRQAECVLTSLAEVERNLGLHSGNTRLFLTGSGGSTLSDGIGGRFVQEVTAVSLAVEALHPETRSVIELGGQDAKMIFFQESGVQGRRKKIATMNDKCAGGTGAVIEKISSKLHIDSNELQTQSYADLPIHPIAGKCGVFAETDITGLQKQGVPSDQLIASLFHAIVLQNLSVLTRGHTLYPVVLLLGGPNTFFPGLQEAWRQRLLAMWHRKNIPIPADVSIDHLVTVPEMSQYFGALGAIEFGLTEEESVGEYLGVSTLREFLRKDGLKNHLDSGTTALYRNKEELSHFRKIFALPSLPPQTEIFSNRTTGFVGLDGGSTSTKAVFLSKAGEVLASAYRISKADPISDAIAVLCDLREQFIAKEIDPQVLAMATTGYSKDLLKKIFSADIAIVETVAHASSAIKVCPDADAIIDVGGQDIKIITLHDGVVKDFRLNTQCSAGNGYFLQAAAESLGVAIEDFAEVAFRAQQMPLFSYGCAIFLQADIVNFQRQGWKPEEILAGLAAVLPKNIFLYVASVSNTAVLGRNFVLQGGTQRNLAVVKSEVDFIQSHYHGDGEAKIQVHPHCREAGAIGAALHAIEHYQAGHHTIFPGLAGIEEIQYQIRRDESTRCSFCTNQCQRTFIDFTTGQRNNDNHHRVILANCERGEAQDVLTVKGINAHLRTVREANPDYVQIAGKQVWESPHAPRIKVPDGPARWLQKRTRPGKILKSRESIRIGIPRALSFYTYAPLFSAYFESLGVPSDHLVYSGYTNTQMYQRAAGFLAIDPCYPSKVGAAHVFELLQQSQEISPLDIIFFPLFDTLTTSLEGCTSSSACPTASATPEAVKAAFSRKQNWFEEAGILYLDPILDLQNKENFQYQMFSCWKDIFGLSWNENLKAIAAGFSALQQFEEQLQRKARATLDQLEEQGRIGLVLLGRPYHHDPGFNQGILEEFQKLGYPIFSQSLLPHDADLLDRLFGEEVRTGFIRSPLDISDVWKNSFSANTNHKLWAAKFVARHPNLISIELSNFKCGHDAFITRTIEKIIEASGKPHFAFRDLDENKPLASIRIRIETMHHFLQNYRKRLTAARSSLNISEASTILN